MLNLTARKFIKLSRICYQTAYLLEKMYSSESEILQDANSLNPFGVEDFQSLVEFCPDLFYIAGFYSGAVGPTACRMQTLSIDSMLKNEDLKTIASETLNLNQSLKTALYKWFVINEHKRIAALSKILTPNNPGESREMLANALDLQARRLEAVWVDRSNL